MEQSSPQVPCAAVAARWIACALLGLLLALLPGARADAAESVSMLSNPIAPQPLATALAEFAHQTRLQLVYVSTIVRARTSKGAPAGIAPTEALTRLLDGTGLRFEFLNPRTVRILESQSVAPTTATRADEVPKRPPGRHSKPLVPALDEVLVTAFRRADAQSMIYDVQTAPASATVVGGDRLAAQKLEQLVDYAAYIPGFVVASGGSPGQATVILRGIAPQGESSSMGFYLDDTPMGASGPHGSPWAFPLDLLPYDLERLEVLRGPQETNFGAGSEAGLVRFVLKAPSVSDFDAHVGADMSTIEGAHKAGGSMRAAINAPLVEGTLGVRVSAYDSSAPGYIDNVYSGAKGVNAVHQYGGRIAALWQPAQNLSIKVGGYWQRIESDSNAIESFTGIYTVPNTGAAYVIGAATSFGDLTENHAFEAPFTQSIDYYSATLHWTPGEIEFVSAAAWSRNKTQQVRDDSVLFGPLFPVWSAGVIARGLARFDRHVGLEKLSEEFRMMSATGRRVEWMLGGFYTHEVATDQQVDYAYDTAYQPIAAFAPAVAYTSLPSTFTEWALFGDLTWQITARIALIGGLRYAYDDQSGLAIQGGAANPSTMAARQRSDTALPWMAAIRYSLAPDVSLYARAATGYKPSTSNAGGPAFQQIAHAETLLNYEAGLKSELLDRKARVDLSVFYVDWRHVQVGTYNPNYDIFDGGDAAVKGAELAVAYSPRHDLELACSAAFTQAAFTKTTSVSYLLADYQLWEVPKWSVALSANYEVPLTSLWHAHVGGVFRWVDHRWAPPVSSLALGGGATNDLPPYSVLDVNARITKGPLALKMFARNLGNTRAYLSANLSFNGADGTIEAIDYLLLQPRTVGIGFDYAF